MTLRLSLTLLSVLALSACDGAGPSDEPLPTREQLVADFGRAAPASGTGRVREAGGLSKGGYDVVARYTTYGQDLGRELTSFYVSLREPSGGEGGIAVEALRVRASEVRTGDAFAVGAYGPNGNGGSGRLYITAVDGKTISGVFAVDTQAANQLYADYRRVTGTFTAVPDSTI